MEKERLTDIEKEIEASASPEDSPGEDSSSPLPEAPPSPEQLWLLPYENPLKHRFPKEFFASIPKSPGVYQMYDGAGTLLYVGKAKCLRDRVRSYKQARPHQVSRKVVRLLNRIREIRWEVCASEKDALLLENKLLREKDPPFNVANTRPDTYVFIGVRFLDVGGNYEARFRLTRNPRRQKDILFGSFKSRGMVREGYKALLRLLWACDNPPDRFAFPTRLTSYKAPLLYTVALPLEWRKDLKRFLLGIDQNLLTRITEKLIDSDQLPAFVYHVIQEDLETLQRFFEFCPRRNRELRVNHGLRTRLIAQEQFDDLVVLEMARQGRVESGEKG